ncbi:MAG: hypothetical protein CML16_14860 [Pusillimonas sp.]|nr:hypothetical protein [Pusillimonas sp.]MBC42817.1 hypothetical protein [Pusillimonas sp.]HCP79411.1 hypothetical protein [Pusillimonas sp.]|tara:strand:- start:260 stop:502 length:243 start_codon:yes stop_codon:yes gene_type:complete
MVWPEGFDADMSGAFTITDLWLHAKWLLCLPGNLLLFAIEKYTPIFARFFEISAQSQYGVSAWIISLIIWVVVISLLSNN